MIKYVLQQCVGRNNLSEELHWIDKITYSPEYYSKRKLNEMMKGDKEKFEREGYVMRIIKRNIIEEVVCY